MNTLFSKFTIYLVVAASVITLFNSCSEGEDATSDSITNQRPHDPWIFRSVLDGVPRSITFALSDDIWASYRTDKAALTKIWGGTVAFEGAVYNHQHGPQPRSVGNYYFENAYPEPWKVVDAAGKEEEFNVEYQGHKVVNDQGVLMYQLIGGGFTIDVEESVDATTSDKGAPIFQRSFTTANVPDGYKVQLMTNANSIIVQQNLSTDGEFEVTKSEDQAFGNKKSALNLHGLLTLASNGSTSLDVKLMNTPLLDNPNQEDEVEESVSTDDIHPGLRLIAKSDCKTCHNKKVKTIGPSYVSIAEKYENTDANINMLANKIKTGGTGVWGNQIMTPHPNESIVDLKTMVQYILSLGSGTKKTTAESSGAADIATFNGLEMKDKVLLPGMMTTIYAIPPGVKNMPDTEGKKPIYAGILKDLDNVSGADFKGVEDNFKIDATGLLFVEKEGEYEFETWSDDGSLLHIHDQLIIDNDGLHGTEKKAAKVNLTKGYHPFRVQYFNGAGGKYMSLNWIKPGDQYAEVIPRNNILHDKDQEIDFSGYTLPMAIVRKIPGSKEPLAGMHPSFNLSQARPNSFTPKVGGMDFMSNGDMIVCVWDASGSVYRLKNVQSGDPSVITAKKIADGLAEPLGLKVVNDRIYVMQKQEMTELVDSDADGQIDVYRTLTDDWGVSDNFHEFGFGLAEKDGHLYATLATGIQPGGASVVDQVKDRGKVVKVNIETGKTEFVASGLRTPNGIGVGYKGDIFVADNQGDWLPSSKIVHVTDGAWFGSRSVDFEGTKGMQETLPVVWLPQDEIGNSPSTPLGIDVGPYKGQMIHGEVTHGGVKRVFVEEVNGQLQGALFRFIQGLEGGVNRLAWGPDGALYAGCIGNPGNWNHTGGKWYGLQRMEYNNKTTFEMLAVRAYENGMEIEFTEPLRSGYGWDVNDYEVKQWYYKPTEEYGGPKLDLRELTVRSASLSDDRKKVFLEINGMKPSHVVYINIDGGFLSESGSTMWSTECWYTMNNIPKGKQGKVLPAPPKVGNNELSDSEKAEGWKLLFDGEKIDQFRNYGKQSIGSSWIIDQDAIHLNAVREDGKWQAKDGGDIMTLEEYEDFEFKVDWKISNCGNSGIIFNVVESKEYDYVWETGPEMQVLDDVCHPDTRYPTHNAGDLYDMIACDFPAVRPAGEWNNVMIRSKGGQVTFYLNGYAVVQFEMHTDEWKERIANSKFKDMPGFGMAKKGHIALQDHGDRVWFRNIKVREI